MAPDRIGRRGHRRTPRRQPDHRGPRRSRHHVPHGSYGTGWYTYGGTSASSPIIASVYTLAGTPNSSDYPAQYPYNAAGTSALNDVTNGSNGSCATAYFCTAGSGYDGPTGWGTPQGTSAFGAS